MTASGNVLLESQDGPLRWLTIDRPQVHNALNAEVLAALDQAGRRAAADPAVRVLLITGAGPKAFSAGADLDELAGADAGTAHRLLARGQRILHELGQLPIPVIAVVNGLALGGGFELALACTLIVASDNASFGLPETGLGLMPGYGGTQRLPPAIGPAAARHVMLTGERLGAARADAVGLLAVPPLPADELRGRASEVGHAIASRGPRATGRVLEAVRANGVSVVDLEHETLLAALCVASDEAAEGIAAFRDRRRPDFGDRAW